MNIKIDLAGVLSEDEKKVLKKILEAGSEKELEEGLGKIGRAAMSEYLEMFLGKQLPTRAAEMKERRLYHLLQNYFQRSLATESDISAMFQLTDRGSKTLLRNVRTKYKYELEQKVDKTVGSILQRAKPVDGNFRLVIQSGNIVEELKSTVSRIGPQLRQIYRQRNSASVFNIPEDTFALLCKRYQVDMKKIAAKK